MHLFFFIIIILPADSDLPTLYLTYIKISVADGPWTTVAKPPYHQLDLVLGFISNRCYGKFLGWGYTHDGRADKNPYPHDRRADKDSYPHDRMWLTIYVA